MFKYSKDRKWYVNVIIFVISVFSIYLLLPLFNSIYMEFIKNGTLRTILSNITLIIVLLLVYYKDLVLEFKTFCKNIKKNIPVMFKYYIAGIVIMIVSNALLFSLIGEIASNESSVREMIFKYPLYSGISVILIAPLMEELIYRKSLRTITDSKWIYGISSFLLFGGAHVIGSFSGTLDLLYIIPYGALGMVFAFMDYDTKSVFSSVLIHSLHNTITFITLLVFSSMGLV